jgi:hypothetical protein
VTLLGCASRRLDHSGRVQRVDDRTVLFFPTPIRGKDRHYVVEMGQASPQIVQTLPPGYKLHVSEGEILGAKDKVVKGLRPSVRQGVELGRLSSYQVLGNPSAGFFSVGHYGVGWITPPPDRKIQWLIAASQVDDVPFPQEQLPRTEECRLLVQGGWNPRRGELVGKELFAVGSAYVARRFESVAVVRWNTGQALTPQIYRFRSAPEYSNSLLRWMVLLQGPLQSQYPQMRVSPDASQIALGYHDGFIQTRASKSSKQCTFAPQEHRRFDLGFVSADRLLVLEEGGRLLACDLDAGLPDLKLFAQLDETATSFATLDDAHIAVATGDGRLLHYRINPAPKSR